MYTANMVRRLNRHALQAGGTGRDRTNLKDRDIKFIGFRFG